MTNHTGPEDALMEDQWLDAYMEDRLSGGADPLGIDPFWEGYEDFGDETDWYDEMDW